MFTWYSISAFYCRLSLVAFIVALLVASSKNIKIQIKPMLLNFLQQETRHFSSSATYFFELIKKYKKYKKYFLCLSINF